MTWVIIGIVLLAAFGPILWLVPSRRDRRLAQIRQAARSEGLTVELRTVPNTHPTAAQRVSAGGAIREPVVSCTGYSHTLRRKLTRLPSVRLLTSPEAERGPREGWEFNPPVPRPQPYLTQLLAVLEPIFAELPDDVIGVEIEPRTLTVLWLEGPGSGPAEVAQIARVLRACEDRLVTQEATIEAELADEDS